MYDYIKLLSTLKTNNSNTGGYNFLISDESGNSSLLSYPSSPTCQISISHTHTCARGNSILFDWHFWRCHLAPYLPLLFISPAFQVCVPCDHSHVMSSMEQAQPCSRNKVCRLLAPQVSVGRKNTYFMVKYEQTTAANADLSKLSHC